jgi:hypothetical protein
MYVCVYAQTKYMIWMGNGWTWTWNVKREVPHSNVPAPDGRYYSLRAIRTGVQTRRRIEAQLHHQLCTQIGADAQAAVRSQSKFSLSLSLSLSVSSCVCVCVCWLRFSYLLANNSIAIQFNYSVYLIFVLLWCVVMCYVSHGQLDAKHHPSSVNNLLMQQLLNANQSKTLLSFLKTEFSCINNTLAKRLITELGSSFSADMKCSELKGKVVSYVFSSLVR